LANLVFQVGVFTCSMRSANEALAGDTFHAKDRPVESLGEVVTPKPMVYAGFYPQEPSELNKLKGAIEKVCLNDSSVTVMMESSLAMGSGWRLGFLGVLHMEVFSQRLQQEQC
jgi:translation elongation factor EF-4